MQTPFALPDKVIIDDQSGYAVNVPFIHQGYVGWWDDDPETTQRILDTRKRLGITVEDFPDGKPADQDAVYQAALRKMGFA